jgi:hypothetical protein
MLITWIKRYFERRAERKRKLEADIKRWRLFCELALRMDDDE